MPYPQFIAPLTPSNLPIQRCPVSREDASKRILIIKLGALGDILMATPLLSALRTAYPDAHLSWMVEHTNQDAIDTNPFVDEVIAWEGGYWTDLMPRRWKKWFSLRRGFGFRWLASAFQFHRELRQRQYDVLISFHPEQWPLLVQGTGCSTAIGVFETQARPGVKQRDYRHLYTDAYPAEELPFHRTEKYLMPLNALGLPPSGVQMTMGFTSQDVEAVTAFLAENGLSEGKRFVVLAPKTTWASRCWPEDRFSLLGDRLTHEMGLNIVLIGSGKEVDSVKRVAASMQVAPVTAAGCLSFRQIAALIARASLVVSSDGGPMHVAAAVGTPYLALFGPTPVAGRAPLIGPGLSLMHPIPCGPCDKEQCPIVGDGYMRCLELITVEEVLESALRLLEGDPAVARTG